jgi:hypothetical protein
MLGACGFWRCLCIATAMVASGFAFWNLCLISQAQMRVYPIAGSTVAFESVDLTRGLCACGTPACTTSLEALLNRKAAEIGTIDNNMFFT